LGAGLDDRGEHVLLLVGEALHGLDQVRDEVRAALVLGEHLRPLGFGGLLIGRNVVDAAAGKCGCKQERGKERRGAGKTLAEHGRPPESRGRARALTRAFTWERIVAAARPGRQEFSPTCLAPLQLPRRKWSQPFPLLSGCNSASIARIAASSGGRCNLTVSQTIRAATL